MTTLSRRQLLAAAGLTTPDTADDEIIGRFA